MSSRDRIRAYAAGFENGASVAEEEIRYNAAVEMPTDEEFRTAVYDEFQTQETAWVAGCKAGWRKVQETLQNTGN